MSWWGLLSIWSTVFATPFVGASEPLRLPLPQTIDYATYMRGQLLASNFSTDPTVGKVRARQDGGHVAAEQDGPQLEAFIINYEPCVIVRDVVAYRIVVRNVGDAPLSGVTAEFSYPKEILEYKESVGLPVANVTHEDGKLTWNIGTILPGHANWKELNVTFIAKTGGGTLATELMVSGGENLVLTGHTVPDNCPTSQVRPEAPAAPKTPAIICDPGEIGCVESIPSLGALFNEVARNPSRQPVVCSPNDPDGCTPNRPQLGVRFAEAVASLLPGECSVLEDGVLADPDFHDGLNRRTDVAAFFMRPLYDSGQDYSRLVLENEMLGIANKVHAKNVLRDIHTKHWQLRVGPLDNVLRGTFTTDFIRERIEQWHTDWLNETQAAQQDLQKRYTALQTAREQRFVPVARRAVDNATASIERACGHIAPPAPADGGLSPLLFTGPASVQNAYMQTLRSRSSAYAATQNLFRDPDNAAFGEEFRAATWKSDLRAALDAFDAGNKKPLQDFITFIPRKDRHGFDAGWAGTYEKHARDDVQADDTVRLNNWEIALDTPKTVAAACARDTTLAARVEYSWCESGDYKEYILTEALNFPTVRDTAPPVLVEEDPAQPTRIQWERTFGISCGGLPSDPFWAADCSCSCDQLIAGQGPNAQVKYCQADKPLEGPPPGPGQPPDSPGGQCAPLQCPNGTQVPTCDPAGNPINYFINPCLIQSPSSARSQSFLPPVIGPTPTPVGTSSPIPPPPPASPPNSCQPITCPNGAQYPTCTPGGLPINYFINPCSVLPPPPPPGSGAPPGQGPGSPPGGQGGLKAIIRPDMFSKAQAPRTQNECLHEVGLDDHFLTLPPPTALQPPAGGR